MLARTAMSSFSDAHEIPEIPIIAANLHRLILPRQSQIWAVLHKSDQPNASFTVSPRPSSAGCASPARSSNSTRASGRSCEARWSSINLPHPSSITAPARIFGNLGPSWRHPKGWQAVRRISRDGSASMLVLHGFADAPTTIELPWPDGDWRLTGKLCRLIGNRPDHPRRSLEPADVG